MQIILCLAAAMICGLLLTRVAKSCIHDVCGSLDRPNAGIMFTVPVTSVEGVE